MGFNPIPEEVRKVWDAWNVRGLIILSLSLQAILILFAPFRKRTSNTFMISVIWSAYLLADWAAAFTVGLISNIQGGRSEPEHNGDLLAFWAPFLLVHLGGPDTITAFALEDNALWLRHLIGLVFQVIAAIYVFLLTLPENKLLAPTIIMLLAGIIKYAERTRGLYLASLDKLKRSMLRDPNPGLNCWKLMDLFASKKNANVPVEIHHLPNLKKSKDETVDFNYGKGELPEDKAVKYAYRFFEMFKGLIVDFIFSVRERNESRSFILGRNAEEAYKVILTELNFMYEVLYTKVRVVHSLVGYIFRFLTFGCTIAALVIFTRLSKAGFHRFDVRITYVLLIAAIAFDLIAMSMVFFSDWTVVNIKNLMERYEMENGAVDRSLTPILRRLLTRKVPRTSKIRLDNGIKYDRYDTPLLNRRWGESMSAYNLLQFCIKDPQAICKQMGCFRSRVHITVTIITSPFLIIVKFLHCLKLFFVKLDQRCCCRYGFIWFGGIFFDHFGLMEIYEKKKYVSKNAFPKQLWEFIFRELEEKSHKADHAETANVISEARGGWVLRDSSLGLADQTRASLMHHVSGVKYDQSVLLWHTATDLCYYTEDKDSSNQRNDYRVFSKILSDYMLYLLLIQPKMMSAVAGIGQIRFMDTCAEAEKFFKSRSLGSNESGEGKLKRACEMILEVNTDYFSSALKGEQSKSVLFDAAILAKELKKLKKQDKDKDKGEYMWKVMCRVWVEILSYAANHCRADAHAQVLSKGGELVTLVWLLMAHLGIGEEFHEDMLADEGRATMKIVVSK